MAEKSQLEEEGLRHLLHVQDGVVARRQLRASGATANDVRRLLRRELTQVYAGVYVNHTGPLTPQQRAWAAVLVHWPAALTRESALHVGEDGPIHVAIAPNRTVRRIAGVRTHRTAQFPDRVQWVKRPPRVAIEHAALDVALSKPDPAARFAVLADVCQQRRTRPERVAAALETRRRVVGKSLLLDMLADLESGACSVLEREYLHLERTHGLPPADRQRLTTLGAQRAYLDVLYGEYGVRVELDGRAYHDNPEARNRDFDRDLAGLVGCEELTVRLTYGQVFAHGCRTARRIATLLERRGWSGPFLTCANCR